ncbi:MAG: FlgD immunoglobulin-like domain containing protein [Bacteroidota bacterium]
MKSKLLLLALACSIGTAYAGGGNDGSDEILRKSGARSATNVSYPVPFNPAGTTARTQPAISTGYYLVDNDDDAGPYWYPDVSKFVQETTNPVLWHDIVTGPGQFPANFWDTQPEGRAYFRNPGKLGDSTNNAFAGPMPIGLNGGFVFNGVRYDSFYVSTNGVIALSNRRYYYNPVDGGRYIPPGATTAYDSQSDDTRARSGDGMADATPDNFGYEFIAVGGNAADSTRGLRYPNSRVGDDNISFASSPTAPPALPAKMHNETPMIAPFWDDLQVSVFNPYENRVDNFGKVRYYRNPDENILVIYYKNLTPLGVHAHPPNVGGSTNFKPDIRPDNSLNDAFVSVSAQVHLNGGDNSITYIYEDFIGAVPVSFTSVSSRDFFRVNSTIGVRGFARHINFPPGGAEVKYLQTTEYLANNAVRTINRPGAANTDNATPRPQLAIKFKQWKNTLRVVNIVYNIPKRAASYTPANNFDSTITVVDNFELLAGDQKLGAIQPVGLFQNLTNNIQGPGGVNYQQQDLSFRVRFKIFNQATGLTIYNRLIDVNQLAISNPTVSGVKLTDATGTPNLYNAATMNGVPPYNYVQVKFPPFETNEFVDNQIGRLQAVIIADPTTPNGESLRDEWPFDDTTGVQLFNIRRMTSFNDDVREYHLIGQTPMPSVTKWVNINGDVLDGDAATYNPPPPRGEYAAKNNAQFKTNSPVIRLNRITLQEAEPSNPYTGDEIISFPIDLRNRKGAVLSVSYQRTGRAQEDWKRGWSDATLYGPEVRTILEGVATNVSGGDAATSGFPDRLLVEFARPSLDAVNGITNIPTANYRFAPRLPGSTPATPITDNPAFTLYGGGGYRNGYDPLEYNKPLTFAEGLVSKIDDDGKDQEFYKVFVTIPDTIINAPNEGAKNFRFRLRVQATPNSGPPGPQDDQDNFFVDNIRILFPSEVPDIELSSIIASWPYTAAPASQATQIPIRAKIANNTGITSQAFSVNARIFRNNNPGDDVYGVYGIGRSLTVPFLPGNREIELPMPNWNARNGGPQGDTTRREFIEAEYTILGNIQNNYGGDLEPLNDTTFSKMKLTFGPVFAYDPISNPTNNVPEQQFSNQAGRGLNLPGANSGGAGAGFGPAGGLASGQIAMRFTLYAQDTVKGYQAFFASLNQDPDQFITFALYRDQGGVPAATPVTGSSITRLRGFDADSNKFFVDRYTNYKLDKDVVLPPGEYWAAVGQTYIGLELGASSSRMGMVTTNISTIPVLGVSGTSVMIDKGFRRMQGTRRINDNRFAYENTKGSGTWNAFMPFVGNPAYAHLDHYGTVPFYQTRTRGTWLPMIRPFLGKRAFNQAILPVELSALQGEVRNGNANLWWSTASESNNAGFDIERRMVGNEDWTKAGFVKGQGNSSKKVNYSFEDSKVATGNTYEYRLRQVDLDGSEEFSNTVELTFGGTPQLALEPSFPNPFSDETNISFRLPVASHVTLEIVDMYGKVVRTLVDGDMDTTPQNIKWNGRNDAGMTVASGSYVYKLIVGDRTETGKITFIQ